MGIQPKMLSMLQPLDQGKYVHMTRKTLLAVASALVIGAAFATPVLAQDASAPAAAPAAPAADATAAAPAVAPAKHTTHHKHHAAAKAAVHHRHHKKKAA